MLKKEKWPLFAILFSLLPSCGPKPPDIFVFENMQQKLSIDPLTQHLILTPSPTCMKEISEVECGHGVSIVSGREIFVGENEKSLFKGKPWSKLKLESVYIPAVESYAPLAVYVITSCKKMNCNKEVDAFRVKLNSLNGISKAIVSP